jgi:hyperosmotically inducible protein
MGLLSAIGRAAPLVVGGVAAGWYLRRRGYLGGTARTALPPAGATGSAIDSTAEEFMEPRPPAEAHLEAVQAVSDAADVTSVVEDLLAAAPGEAEVTDAKLVGEPLPDDPEVAGAVRLALAGEPGLLTGAVDVEVVGGIVWLHGAVAQPEDAERARRRAASVRGVREVRNELRSLGQEATGAGPDG